MNAKYEAGKAEANDTLEAQRTAAADAQAAITQAAEAKLTRLQLQVCMCTHTIATLSTELTLSSVQNLCEVLV